MSSDAGGCVLVMARADDVRHQLTLALSEAGFAEVTAVDPNFADPRDVYAMAPEAVLVLLEPAIEDALEQYETLLSDSNVRVLFDDADMVGRRSGWESVRWLRHLKGKLGIGAPQASDAADEEIESVHRVSLASAVVRMNEPVPPADDFAIPVQSPPSATPDACRADDFGVGIQSTEDEAAARSAAEHADRRGREGADVTKRHPPEPIDAQADSALESGWPLPETDSKLADGWTDTHEAFLLHSDSGQAASEEDGDVADGNADTVADAPGMFLLLAAIDDVAQSEASSPAQFEDELSAEEGGAHAPLGETTAKAIDWPEEWQLVNDAPEVSAPSSSAEPFPDVSSHLSLVDFEEAKAPQDIAAAAVDAVADDGSTCWTDVFDDGPIPATNGAGVAQTGGVYVLAGLGGADAIRHFLAEMNPEFDLTVLVRMHMQAGNYDRLVNQMTHAGPMPVRLAMPGQLLEAGVVYFLPPDVGVASWDGRQRFVLDAAAAIKFPPDWSPSRSAYLFLSGSDPAMVDAAADLGLLASEALVAGQALEGCYDPEAPVQVQSRGGESATPAQLAKAVCLRFQAGKSAARNGSGGLS